MISVQTVFVNKNPPAANPLVWLDASDSRTIVSPSSISQWKDKSGNGFDANQGNGSLQPSVTNGALSGKNVVTFNGSQTMTISNLPLALFTIFILFKSSATAGVIYEHSTSVTDGSFLYGSTGSTVSVGRGSVLTQRNLSANWGTGNIWRAVSHLFGGTNLTNNLYINQANQTLSDSTANNPGSASVTANLFLASNGSGSLFLTGDMAEVIVYNRFLPVNELNAVFFYLRRKWAY